MTYGINGARSRAAAHLRWVVQQVTRIIVALIVISLIFIIIPAAIERYIP